MLKRFVIFCIVGLFSAIVDLFIFNILFKIGFLFPICRTLAVFSAVVFNFYFNRNITFNARDGRIKRQFPRHIIIYSLVLITNVAVSSIAVYLLGENLLNANIASILGIVSGIPISFFGSLFWTFSPAYR